LQNNLKVELKDLGVMASQVEMSMVNESDLTDLDVVTTLGSNLQSWDLVKIKIFIFPFFLVIAI